MHRFGEHGRGLAPTESAGCLAEAVEIFDFDVVGFSAFERHRAGHPALAMIGPLIDQQLAVDEKARAVIAGEGEAVAAGLGGSNVSGPADGKIVRADAWRGGVVFPVEIDAVIDAA